MINHKTVLAIIPARGGSKGVARKNIKPLSGQPLIYWTINAAKNSRYIDRLILSSEDDEIIKVAEELGCEVPFKRPTELARDDTPGIEPVLHALHTLQTSYDYIIMLQPTSPLRTSDDIDSAIELCNIKHAPFCVSVSEPKTHPYWTFKLDNNDHLVRLFPDVPVRRQELPDLVTLNGAIYIAKSSELLSSKSFLTDETVAYVMPEERSLDIDTALDFKMCEIILAQNN